MYVQSRGKVVGGAASVSPGSPALLTFFVKNKL